ncbi:MAG: hypothetical protein FJ272_09140, partial [Planctomycetes bacterium]|nr:hypothetical protein [Planctomycetota bacterium]
MAATTSPRIERLKQRLLAGELPKPVHSEAFTRAYRQHESGPPLSRLAKAMREAWLAMPIVVGEDELLVGGNYLQAIAGYHYCGGGLFCDRALAERLKQTRDPAAVREMDDVLAYWQDRTTSAVFSRRLAAEGIKLPGCLAWGS